MATYTREQVLEALKNADAQGKTEDAHRLAEEVLRMSQVPQDTPEDTPEDTGDRDVLPPPEPETRALQGFIPEISRRFGFDPRRDTDTGDLIIQSPEAPRVDPFGGLPRLPGGDAMNSLPFVMGKAARDAASGLLNLPGDLMDDPSMRVQLPEFRGSTGENITSGVLQYGVPAVSAANATMALLAKYLPKAGSLIRTLFSVTSAAGADAAVTDTTQDVHTLGNLVPILPTAIDEDDSNLMKRVKVGSEAGGLGLLADTLVGTARAVTRPFRKKAQKEAITNKIAEELQDRVIDKDAAIANIDESLARSEIDRYQPSVGTASNDPFLLSIERGSSTTPESLARVNANRARLSQQVDEATDTRALASPEAAVDEIRARSETELAARETSVSAREAALETAEKVNTDTATALAAAERGQGGAASTRLDEQLVDLHDAQRRTKGEKFDAIDPEGRVRLSTNNPMKKAIDEIRQGLPTSTVARINRYAGGILDDLSTAITFKDMQSLRGTLSGAIEEARRAGAGDVVMHLNEVKRAFEKVTDSLSGVAFEKNLVPRGTTVVDAPQDAGKRAEEAKEFFKDEFAPNWREGEGETFAKGIERGALNRKPSETAGKFLGSKEGAEQLRKLIAQVDDPAAAERAVRDYLMSEIAAGASVGLKGVNPVALNKIIETRKEILAQFPAVRAELIRLRNQAKSGVEVGEQVLKDLKAAREQLALTQSQQRMNATKLMLDGDDPVAAVGRALESNAPLRKLDELKTAVAGSETAEEGLKSAVRQWVGRKVKLTVSAAGEVGQSAVSLAKLDKILTDPVTRKALASMHTRAEMQTLDGVLTRLNEMARINQMVTAGSDTAVNIAAQQNKLRIFAAAYFGIIKGRGVFMISKMLQDITGAEPKRLAIEVLDTIMLDPKFAKMLLLKDTNAHRLRLKTYLTNNFLDIFESGTRDDSGVESDPNL